MDSASKKIAIIYSSIHHKNTEKLVKAISNKYEDVLLLDANKVILKNLQDYDIIGIASGIYFGKMHKSALKVLADNLPEHKKVFIIYTSGSTNDNYGKDAEEIIKSRKCTLVGKYSCLGFDTFGPLKLIGGINKQHPTEEEIEKVVGFVEGMV